MNQDNNKYAGLRSIMNKIIERMDSEINKKLKESEEICMTKSEARQLKESCEVVLSGDCDATDGVIQILRKSQNDNDAGGKIARNFINAINEELESPKNVNIEVVEVVEAPAPVNDDEQVSDDINADDDEVCKDEPISTEPNNHATVANLKYHDKAMEYFSLESKLEDITNEMKANGFDARFPIQVYKDDNDNLIVWDGITRCKSAEQADIKEVPVVYSTFGSEDEIVYAILKTQSLRRNNSDAVILKSIEMLLEVERAKSKDNQGKRTDLKDGNATSDRILQEVKSSTNERIAKMLGTNRNKVTQAIKIIGSSSEQINKVLVDRLKIDKVYKQMKKDNEDLKQNTDTSSLKDDSQMKNQLNMQQTNNDTISESSLLHSVMEQINDLDNEQLVTLWKDCNALMKVIDEQINSKKVA